MPTAKHLLDYFNYVGASFIVSGWSRTPNSRFIYIYNKSTRAEHTQIICTIYNTHTGSSKSDIKLRRTYIVDRDEICEESVTNRNHLEYDRNRMFCTNHNEVPCTYDGPIMGIDAYDPENPYWYVVGFHSNGPAKCKRVQRRPKFSTKVVAYLNWIDRFVKRK